MAVGGSRQRILNSRSYSPYKIFCFDPNERIVGYQPVLFMQKNFPLKSKVDEVIRNTFEGGLFQKWDRDSQRKKELLRPYEPKLELSMREYSFLFYVIFNVGVLLSTLSLICEIITYRKINQSARLSVWKYLGHFFDGNRHYFKNIPEKLKQNAKWNDIISDEK